MIALQAIFEKLDIFHGFVYRRRVAFSLAVFTSAVLLYWTTKKHRRERLLSIKRNGDACVSSQALHTMPASFMSSSTPNRNDGVCAVVTNSLKKTSLDRLSVASTIKSSNCGRLGLHALSEMIANLEDALSRFQKFQERHSAASLELASSMTMSTPPDEESLELFRDMAALLENAYSIREKYKQNLIRQSQRVAATNSSSAAAAATKPEGDSNTLRRTTNRKRTSQRQQHSESLRNRRLIMAGMSQRHSDIGEEELETENDGLEFEQRLVGGEGHQLEDYEEEFDEEYDDEDDEEEEDDDEGSFAREDYYDVDDEDSDTYLSAVEYFDRVEPEDMMVARAAEGVGEEEQEKERRRLAFYFESMQQVAEHGIYYFNCRASALHCGSESEYFAKLVCVRHAFKTLLANVEDRAWLIDFGFRAGIGLLNSLEAQTDAFKQNYKAFIEFAESEQCVSAITAEMSIKHADMVNLFDLVFDRILLEAFEQLLAPPATLTSLINNRWLSNSFKRRSMDSLIWTLVLAKKKLLPQEAPHGFKAHLLDLLATLAAPLAWAFLATDPPTNHIATRYKDCVTRFMIDVFAFEKMRWCGRVELTNDVRSALRQLADQLCEIAPFPSSSHTELAASTASVASSSLYIQYCREQQNDNGDEKQQKQQQI